MRAGADVDRFDGIDAVLFDFDGTLADTVEDLHAAINLLLRERHCRMLSVGEVRGMVGAGERALVAQVLHAAGGALADAEAEQALQRFQVLYADCSGRSTGLYPGAAWTLRRLHAMGYPLALVSNKSFRFLNPLLLRCGISGAFSALVGGDSTPHRKPEPEPLLHACAALGVPPARALMIGDSPIDVAAAQSAGCRIACVAHGYSLGVAMSSLGVPMLDRLEDLPGRLPSSPVPELASIRRPSPWL